MKYAELLRDPRWQKKRLEVLSAAEFKCSDCEDDKSPLHVHHRYYVSGRLPWEYPDFCFVVLCKTCHGMIPDFVEQARQDHQFALFNDWEVALDHFGTRIISLMQEELKHREDANK